MIPSAGRIVKYTLTDHDAVQVHRRRAAAVARNPHDSGFVVYVGNPVREGDEFPLVITMVWKSSEGGAVNGQVLLDGNDTLWVTSRVEGFGAGQWEKYPIV